LLRYAASLAKRPQVTVACGFKIVLVDAADGLVFNGVSQVVQNHEDKLRCLGH